MTTYDERRDALGAQMLERQRQQQARDDAEVEATMARNAAEMDRRTAEAEARRNRM